MIKTAEPHVTPRGLDFITTQERKTAEGWLQIIPMHIIACGIASMACSLCLIGIALYLMVLKQHRQFITVIPNFIFATALLVFGSFIIYGMHGRKLQLAIIAQCDAWFAGIYSFINFLFDVVDAATGTSSGAQGPYRNILYFYCFLFALLTLIKAYQAFLLQRLTRMSPGTIGNYWGEGISVELADEIANSKLQILTKKETKVLELEEAARVERRIEVCIWINLVISLYTVVQSMYDKTLVVQDSNAIIITHCLYMVPLFIITLVGVTGFYKKSTDLLVWSFIEAYPYFFISILLLLVDISYVMTPRFSSLAHAYKRSIYINIGLFALLTITKPLQVYFFTLHFNNIKSGTTPPGWLTKVDKDPKAHKAAKTSDFLVDKDYNAINPLL